MESYLSYSESTNEDLSESYSELKFNFLITNIGINISVFFVYGLSSILKENNNWRKISEEIALKYQSKIKEINDKWNVYIIYVCIDKMTKELKNEVENNKFSSRKIVEDDFQSEFTIEEAKNLIVKHITNTDLIQVIEKTDNSIQENYNPIYEKLWQLIPCEESISGNTDKQKELVELLKQL